MRPGRLRRYAELESPVVSAGAAAAVIEAARVAEIRCVVGASTGIAPIGIRKLRIAAAVVEMMLAAVFRTWGIVIVVDDILFDRPLKSHSRAHAVANAGHSPASHAHPHAGMAEAAMQQRLYA